MKNAAKDLYNHLFLQLERLNDEKLKGDKLKEECDRASALSAVAGNIVNLAKVEVSFRNQTGGKFNSNFLSIEKP